MHPLKQGEGGRKKNTPQVKGVVGEFRAGQDAHMKTNSNDDAELTETHTVKPKAHGRGRTQELIG